MRLLDVNGTVIAGREETGWSLAHIPEVQMALKGQYASAIRQRISDEPPPPLYSLSRGTHIRVFIAFPIIEKKHLQGVLYLSRTPNNILKHLFEVKNKVFTVSFGLLVLVVLLVLFVSATISRPIRELIEQTESVKKGRLKFTEPLKYPVTYEIARLSESFATMSKALALRTDYIQRFATHVSHEFKTPLSSMQGTLELLQDHLETMPEDQRQHFLNNLLSDTQRLKILVNRLLELARADVLEPAPLNACLTEMLEKLKDNFNDRGLAVNFSNTEVYWLSIAPDALEIILLNLLENSLQHGASQVDVKTSLKDRVLEIYLQDNGSGISFANRNKIFTAFFTTRRNTGGTGLGLEIVSSLLKAFDGNIKLLESEHGALFLLTLSLATRTH
jgi:signal transduction histidine kinase